MLTYYLLDLPPAAGLSRVPRAYTHRIHRTEKGGSGMITAELENTAVAVQLTRPAP